MITKEQKQPVYDIIATLDAKVGIGKGKGFTQTQAMKSLFKHFPFVKDRHYYFPKARKYGKVRDDIDLIYYFRGSKSELTTTYFVKLFLKQGKALSWIRKHLGEKAVDLVYRIRQLERRRAVSEVNKQIIGKYRGKKEKKINLDFIISTMKSAKTLQSAWYLLRQYTRRTTVIEHLKRYGLAVADVIEKDMQEIKHIVSKHYCTKKFEITDYELFLKALFEQEPLSNLDRFLVKKSNRKAVVRDKLKNLLLTRITIDKMIIKSKDFEDFKAKFEDYIYSYINNTYFKNNNVKQQKKEIKRKIREKIVKDIDDINTFLQVAMQEGYTIAIRRCKDRNKVYRYILKHYKNVDNFKKLLKERKIGINY